MLEVRLDLPVAEIRELRRAASGLGAELGARGRVEDEAAVPGEVALALREGGVDEDGERVAGAGAGDDGPEEEVAGEPEGDGACEARGDGDGAEEGRPGEREEPRVRAALAADADPLGPGREGLPRREDGPRPRRGAPGAARRTGPREPEERAADRGREGAGERRERAGVRERPEPRGKGPQVERPRAGERCAEEPGPELRGVPGGRRAVEQGPEPPEDEALVDDAEERPRETLGVPGEGERRGCCRGRAPVSRRRGPRGRVEEARGLRCGCHFLSYACWNIYSIELDTMAKIYAWNSNDNLVQFWLRNKINIEI